MTGVEIAGGRGLLSVTDIDTIFQDVMIVLVILLLWKQRHTLRQWVSLVAFSLMLSGSTAVLLGHAVENVGTLWRMRALIAVQLWLLGVAASQRAETPDASSATSAAAAC